jgi:DNA-binding NarL/FixJ family response regulator
MPAGAFGDTAADRIASREILVRLPNVEAVFSSRACALDALLGLVATALSVVVEGAGQPETLRSIRAEFPDARILMLTSSKDGDDMSLAMQSGARGYVVKTVRHDELARAIRTVHEGGLVSPQLPTPPKPATNGPLSQRELEVLGLVRQGFSNDEIARLLGISERTVRAHMTAILARLAASDRAQAVAIGYELGLFRPAAHGQRS